MARFNSLTKWLRWQEEFHPRSIDLGLERAADIFKVLVPHHKKPPTIIVGGTNGKGSSIAFLEAIYRAQGYRVGAYTSPHILKYNERIRINGQAATDAQICQAFARIDAIRHTVSLSYFEFGTLAALDIFARSNLDIQILEVGLGGRLDAVNIIDGDVSIITNVCIDHVDWLGETREAIGREKAGIFRRYTPVIIGDTNPPHSLLACAHQTQSPLFCINQAFSHRIDDNGDWDWSCQVNQSSFQYNALPAPTLKGVHQYDNAASVLMAINQMTHLLPISEQSIHQGLRAIDLKGRFQLIKAEVSVLLDVAHNPQAVTALLNNIKNTFSGKKIYAIFSIMKDKDIISILNIIKPVISHWYFAPINIPRVVGVPFIKQCFAQCGIKNITLTNSGIEAYHLAKMNAKHNDLILVFGSFLLISQFLLEFEKR